MPVADLVRMANQIAANLRQHSPEQASDELAAHLRQFWAPKMRSDLIAYSGNGTEDLDPVVLLAISQLKSNS